MLKKKRPAPAPPTAVKRDTSYVEMSAEAIQAELSDIGDRLVEIQDNVTRLESAFQAADAADQDHSEMIFNYMEFARQKCMLARRQEELMYQWVFCVAINWIESH